LAPLLLLPDDAELDEESNLLILWLMKSETWEGARMLSIVVVGLGWSLKEGF
jgi:hypothetical protein